MRNKKKNAQTAQERQAFNLKRETALAASPHGRRNMPSTPSNEMDDTEALIFPTKQSAARTPPSKSPVAAKAAHDTLVDVVVEGAPSTQAAKPQAVVSSTPAPVVAYTPAQPVAATPAQPVAATPAPQTPIVVAPKPPIADAGPIMFQPETPASSKGKSRKVSSKSRRERSDRDTDDGERRRSKSRSRSPRHSESRGHRHSESRGHRHHRSKSRAKDANSEPGASTIIEVRAELDEARERRKEKARRMLAAEMVSARHAENEVDLLRLTGDAALTRALSPRQASARRSRSPSRTSPRVAPLGAPNEPMVTLPLSAVRELMAGSPRDDVADPWDGPVDPVALRINKTGAYSPRAGAMPSSELVRAKQWYY